MARAEGYQGGLRAYLNVYSFSPVILNGAQPKGDKIYEN